MTLTIICATLAIILTILFLVNHWKGILKMWVTVFIGYLAVGCLWDALHGHISGGAIMVFSILLIVVGCWIISLLKRL